MTDLKLARIDRNAASMEEALSVVDDLRRRVEAGDIKAFVVVGVAPDHESMSWAGYTAKTTRLELQGAIMQLFLSF